MESLPPTFFLSGLCTCDEDRSVVKCLQCVRSSVVMLLSLRFAAGGNVGGIGGDGIGRRHAVGVFGWVVDLRQHAFFSEMAMAFHDALSILVDFHVFAGHVFFGAEECEYGQAIAAADVAVVPYY